MSNASLFRRYNREQDRLLLATLPKSGVLDYDLPDIDLTNLVGPTARAQAAAARLRKGKN
jgi:hypothetical protein